MASFFFQFLTWLPAPLFAIACGVIALFFLFTLFHLIRFILDLIPFL